MSKEQIQIDLTFDAHTEKAKASILDLQKTLSNIAKMPQSASALFDDRDLKKASAAALDLQKHLQKAVNVKTGKLDLSRFSVSLKAAGKDLNKYYDDFLRIGPAGEQTFLKLAHAVATAETPMIRVNKRLEEMGKALKNTIRWQISSTILHGFMSSVSSAYRYAQDLNESLNNIRIVTGQSTDQMAKFAEQANRSARALSTTTNEYAKASLIYYQQGLSDTEVQQKTDITIKMANVARESAETVSDQMTAVWNNFYDGSKSLEHYADAMTALGAATASSTSEISEGLNKFAAIADTVGLSYEYATSALATVTSTTRQSAEVVGTAFKTMFARIQGLKLGESLDDGTTLNKYSEALMAVGININDSNGRLKDMDVILDEMAHKWTQIDKNSQVALAQTVAGTRQYTQLVALMDNWDFMEQNLKVVEESDGALQEQQEIYAEGWEAASDRVRAAMEAVYHDILDDHFFIGLLNGLEKVVEGIHGVTEGLGGMKGIAALAGSVFLNMYAKKMPETLQNFKANLMVFFGQSDKEITRIQNETKAKLAHSMSDPSTSATYKVKAQGLIELTDLKQRYAIMSKNMTTLEQAEAENRIKAVEAINDEIVALKEKEIALKNVIKAEKEQVAKSASKKVLSFFTSSIREQGNKSEAEDREVEIKVARAKAETELKKIQEDRKRAQAEIRESQKKVKGYTSKIEETEESDSTGSSKKSKKQQGQERKKRRDRERYEDLRSQEESRIDTQQKAVSSSFGREADVQSILDHYDKQLEGIARIKKNAEDTTERVTSLVDYFKEELGENDEGYLTLEALSQDSDPQLDDQGKKDIEASVSKLIDKYSTNAESLAKVTTFSEGLQGQVENWEKYLPEISQAPEEVAKFKDSMVRYLDVIQKESGETKITIQKNGKAITTSVADQVKEITEAMGNIDTKDPEAAKKYLDMFKELQTSLSGPLCEQIKKLQDSLLSLDDVLDMVGDENASRALLKIKEEVGNLAQVTAAAEAQKENKEGIDLPSPKFDAAQTWTELGAILMSTYGLVTTLKSAFSVLGDEEATAFEKIGASISVVTTAVEGFHSVQRLATSAIQNNTIVTMMAAKAESALTLVKKLSTSANQRLAETNIEVANTAMMTKVACIEIVAVMAAIALAIAGLVLAYRWLSGAMDVEQMEKSTEAFKEQKQVVQELSNELQTVKDRIRELQGQDNLTIVEQEELNKLKVSQALLEAQLRTEKEMAKVKAQEANEDIEKVVHGMTERYQPIELTSERAKFMNGDYGPEEDIYKNPYEAYSDKERLDLANIYEDPYKQTQEQYDNYLSGLENGAIRNDEFMSETQEALKRYRQITHGKDYDDLFLNPLIEMTHGFSSDKLLDESADWSKNISQETLDRMGVSADHFNEYMQQNAKTLNENNISVKDLKGLNQKDIAVLFKNIDSLSEKGSQSLQDYLHGISNSIDNSKFIELKNNLIEVDKISKDMSVGKILKPEDYETLTKYNEQLSKYFTILSDGSAIFTGDPLDYQQEVKGLKQDALKEKIDEYNIADFEKKDIDYQKSARDNFLTDEQRQLYGQNDITTARESHVNAYKAERQSLYNELALSAESAEERASLYDSGDINQSAYGTAAQTAMNQEAWEGVDSTEVEEYSEILQETAEYLKDNEEAAEDVARAVVKMNKGVKTLADNWEDWGSILKDSSDDSEEWAKAMTGTKKAISDVLDVSEEFIDTDWVSSAENLELIGKAAEGDEEAINALGVSLAKDIASDHIDNLKIKFNANDLGMEEAGAQIESMRAQFISAIDDVSKYISDTNLQPGEMLDKQSLIDNLNDMVEKTGMSVEEANAMYRSMGFTPEFEMISAEQSNSIPLTTTYHSREVTKRDEFDQPKDWIDSEYSVTRQVAGGTLETALPSMTVETNDGYKPQVPSPKIKKLIYTGGGSMNNRSTSNPGGRGKGGGGSKPKKTKVSKKSEVVERYKEINDSLDDLTDALEDVNKQSDHLYGAEKIAKMEKVNKLLEREVELTEQKKKEAQGYLKEDREALEKAANEAGLEFHVVNGNIVNYKEQMTKLFDELYEAQTSANADGNATEEEEEEIKKIQEKIDKVKEALEQYDETRELIEDLDNEIQDKIYEWQDKNYEILQYKLELKIEINDMELQTLEYYMNKLEGDFYKMAEAAGYLGDQYPLYEQALQTQKDFYDQLVKDHEDGKITDEKYMEGLKETREAILDNLSSLRELDSAMLEYYGNTLAAAGEEIAKVTERMAHQNAVLDHYRTIMELMGKSTDYSSILKVLDGQIQTQENSVEVAKKEYAFYRNQADQKKAEMEKAYAEGNQALGDLLKEEWEIAEQTANEAQDRLLSETEAWAEKVNERLTISLEQAAKNLDKALAGTHFSSLESMNKELERAASLQEEYLTTTNKIYETDKLMRTAQQNIDRSTNNIAKKKLANFIKETEALQNQNKVSKYELEIQQAKYELLLAEIALEEAQNAKDKVRLSRDDEGNFSYIYTADAQAVSDAEQKYQDAQNNLYNIGLEGANKYAEQEAQLLSEMYQELEELDQKHQEQGTKDTAEYAEEREKIQQHYLQKLEDAKRLHDVAIGVDDRVSADAWSTNIHNMMTDAADWENALVDHAQAVDSAFKSWEQDMERIAKETVGPGLESLTDNVDELVESNKELTNELTRKDGIIDSVEALTNSVSEQTKAYGTLRQELLETIKAYESLYKEMTKIAQDELNPEKPIKPEQEEKEESSTVGGDKGSTPNPKKPAWKDVYAVYEKINNGIYPTGYDARVKAGKADGYSEKTVALAQDYLNYIYSGYSEAEAKKAVGYRTGGYTGAWGPEGKLAFLHEKELVLNKDDTENLMSVINFTRDIIKTVEDKAKSVEAWLASLIGENTIQQPVEKQKDTLDQTVSISANFPNVNSKQEIEEAFRDLVLGASQYAYRQD